MLKQGEGLCYEVIRTKYEGWQNLGSSRTLSKQSTCWNSGMIWGGYVDIMRKQDDLIRKWYLVLEMAMW